MKSYAQTPEGWIWIDVPDDPMPPPKTDMQLLRDDVAAIKTKLGIP